MERVWSVQDAKNRFSAVVAAAVKGAPQTVTKHGRPTIVILSAFSIARTQTLRDGAS
jgi:prevent-host-death family protein